MGSVLHTGRNESCCNTTELCKSFPCDIILCGVFLAAVREHPCITCTKEGERGSVKCLRLLTGGARGHTYVIKI